MHVGFPIQKSQTSKAILLPNLGLSLLRSSPLTAKASTVYASHLTIQPENEVWQLFLVVIKEALPILDNCLPDSIVNQTNV